MLEDSHAVDQAVYKEALRRYASGVTVVTTRVNDVDHAMTATAFSAVSLDPPLVLVCVGNEARIHQAMHRSDLWGVSILGDTDEARAASNWLATKGRPLEGQLERFAVVRGVTGTALFSNSLAHLECRTTQRVEAGDHTIIVGTVLRADATTSAERPLVYFQGDYRTTTTPH